MNVENSGRRQLAQWKVAMPVGSVRRDVDASLSF